jgi:hypothetical protein
MRMPPMEPSSTGWTYDDDALFYNAHVLAGLLVGVRPQPIPRTIALRNPHEDVVASGPFRRDYFGTSGDGSYSVLSTRGKASVLTQGYVLFHNEVKRRGAKRAMTPMWRPRPVLEHHHNDVIECVLRSWAHCLTVPLLEARLHPFLALAPPSG